jgi:Nucleoside 2-deoxyribosyltransferase like
MAHILKPPASLDFDRSKPSVFLAGSIEMGQAEAWQVHFEEGLRGAEITILNPRRDDWDSSWVQRIDNPQFRAQVEWELAGQEAATLIAIYFVPSTKAPVTLLELGLFARSGKVVVCCPDGYWRKGNVEVVCARYGVPMVASLDDLIAYALKATAP